MEYLEAAAATPDVPPFVNDAAARIAQEGGVLGPLLILALCALAVLSWAYWKQGSALREAQKEFDKDRDDWQTALNTLHDKRIEELRETTKAINNSTAAIGVLSQGQVDRTNSSQEIAGKLNQLLLITQNNASLLDRNLAVYERGLRDLHDRIRGGNPGVS